MMIVPVTVMMMPVMTVIALRLATSAAQRDANWDGTRWEAQEEPTASHVRVTTNRRAGGASVLFSLGLGLGKDASSLFSGLRSDRACSQVEFAALAKLPAPCTPL
jgi:hypothetical protein